MKKKHSPEPEDDELRPEYGPELFCNMKPNRFANQELRFKGNRAVLLDEDVAEVFDSQEAVNTVLRSAIKAMRTAAPKKKVSAKTAREKRRS